jgi:hypothetical protein
MRSRTAIELAEQYADSKVTYDEMQLAAKAAWQVNESDTDDAADAAACTCFQEDLWQANWCSIVEVSKKVRGAASDEGWQNSRSEDLRRDASHAAWQAESTLQSDLLRDIIANPFRAVSMNCVWSTSDVIALAEAIYTERAFDRLPILADALEDAGCDHADILEHCRGPGPHVRGCWVVDLLLGKS